MGRLAFIFAGQGDQHPGMGEKVHNEYKAAREVFDFCDSVRPGTSKQCFAGTEEELKETKNTQPCMFAVELAEAAALVALGLKADLTAGFSLGELSALTFAGVMTLKDGFSLVCKRGELMQRAAEKQNTFMAAVIRLTDAQVKSICESFEGVYPVNYNCPGQITVSGAMSMLENFSAAVKKAGGRVLPLKVRGAFHSPYMADASDVFAKEIANASLSSPLVTVYSNVTAMPYGESAQTLLSRQMTSPVLWEKTIRNMIADGADTFIEIGPGKTLCGFIARIDSSVRTFPVSGFDDLRELVREVEKC